MTESLRIRKLFEDLYNGRPWLEVTLMEKLEGLSAEQAQKQLFPGWNSAWQIARHLAKWRTEVLRRMQGEITVSPEDNYLGPLADRSEDAWREALAELRETQDQWLRFLETFNEADFEKVYPGNGKTFYEHILGIIQHDAYHLGQISLLIKGTR